MDQHFIAWWNLENLFDVEGSPDRPDYVAKRLASELKGWTAEVLDKKIAQLSWVIKQMNDGQGPDILGVCEVENENVVERLSRSLRGLGRRYKVIHHDTSDGRGIDVAFIYDEKKYDWDRKVYHYEVMKRSATRDILQASLTTSQGTELIIIGNHWPSRSGGQYKTAPYRMMVGETLSYWLKRIQEIKGTDAAIFVMGDFNDEPYSRSLTDYALSTMSRNRVVYGRNPYLYNVMWPLLGERRASYVFGSEPLMIDQILVSKGIAKKTGLFALDDSKVGIELYKGMVKGRYDTPVRFGRPSSGYNPDGFSDHLPISMVLGEK
ncbi:MAG: endonuclease/exonuclease/phosphatase family protein [Candidatus Marinimicrobia bacterium]|nr:endonuclease/exonuclease/phosphatase family protein [Candidatus Neomarinimicrobiota bacterium]